jgi:hypothetical protein
MRDDANPLSETGLIAHIAALAALVFHEGRVVLAALMRVFRG